jgi:hypothetical protein
MHAGVSIDSIDQNRFHQSASLPVAGNERAGRSGSERRKYIDPAISRNPDPPEEAIPGPVQLLYVLLIGKKCQ